MRRSTTGKQKKRKSYKLFFVLLPIVLAAGLWGLLTSDKISIHQNAEVTQPPAKSTSIQTPAVKPTGLQENRSIYSQDQNNSLVHLYVTVVNEENPQEKTTTFEQIHLSQTNPEINGENDEKVKVILQEGTEAGPAVGYFGYSTRRANGTLEIRGASSRRVSQKSYKIRLFDSAGYWRDQRNINLNKHNDDITRVRQKLSFDYFKTIPNFTSMRTQFVHLHVKDLTGNHPHSQFVDYGLYTEIEQANKSFLEGHGLDRNGNLYKPNQFEFFRYPDKLKLTSDPGYDKKAFESVLEIKGSDNHQKLLTMLGDLNNPAININTIIDKYFDRDNYLTWMAVNILMGNIDTNGHNFYLYSPSDSSKWYFLPWDYDLSWGYFEAEEIRSPNQKLANWQSSFGFYWGSVLHQRFLKNPENVKALRNKVEELSKLITKERTTQMLKGYYPIVSPFVKRQPDLYHLPYAIENFEKEYWAIPDEPQRNKQDFYRKLENPMPIYLNTPSIKGNMITFSWDHSYDLQGDDLTYDFAVSYDPSFKKIYYQAKGLRNTSVAIKKPFNGRYFMKLIIRDSKENEQTPFDYYDEEDARYHGVREFFVR